MQIKIKVDFHDKKKKTTKFELVKKNPAVAAGASGKETSPLKVFYGF